MADRRSAAQKRVQDHKDGTKGSRDKRQTSRDEIDAYLAALPDEQRRVLETLRKTIRAAAPKAEECISYRLPAYRLDGKMLVFFGAAARVCSFYPGSGTAVEAHADALEGYKTSKGAVHFDPERPLPAALVRKIVKYRIMENAAQPRPAARTGSRRS